MLQSISIQKRVRLTFDPRFPLECEVAGIERDDEDQVTAVLFKTLQVEGGTVYFEAADLAAAVMTFLHIAPTSN